MNRSGYQLKLNLFLSTGWGPLQLSGQAITERMGKKYFLSKKSLFLLGFLHNSAEGRAKKESAAGRVKIFGSGQSAVGSED